MITSFIIRKKRSTSAPIGNGRSDFAQSKSCGRSNLSGALTWESARLRALT